MLLFLILSTLFSSSTAQPRPPAGLIANLAGDAAQAIPEGAVANAIPEEIIISNMSPYLGFDDALRSQQVYGWTDDFLVRQFSKQEPEKVKNFIFRELDNPAIDDAARLRHLDMLLNENGGRLSIRGEIQNLAIHGKVDLLQEILNRYPYLVRGLKFSTHEISEAAHRGHARMVNFILDTSRGGDASHGLTMAALRRSVDNNQFEVFRILVDREYYLLNIIQYAIESNARSYVLYGLQKIRYGLRQTAQPLPENWYSRVVSNYVGAGRSPEMLEYLLSQPEWNPVTIQNLLTMINWGIINRNSVLTTRLGREFLNPRLTFRVADGIQKLKGIDALNAAIREAEADSNLENDLVNILKRTRNEEGISQLAFN